jgi:H+/Cl- antiporter ClcA
MRKAPMNYLLTAALAALAWVGTAIYLGGYLGERVTLESAPMETFLSVYRLILLVVAALGLAICCYWYFYGAKPAAGADIRGARQVWRISLIMQIVLAAGAVIALVLAFPNDRLENVQYLIVFASGSAQTWILFWLCSFFLSPRAVEHVPYGRG